MPGGDGTGPWGRGPMTGRGAGYCGGYYAGPPGRGLGRGRGWFFQGPQDNMPTGSPIVQPYSGEPSREDEKRYLECIVKEVEAELESIKGRLEELSSEKDK